MKKLVLIIISLAPCLCYGQKRVEKLDQYTASNGITYKPGDEIELGRGSGTHGEFLYILFGGLDRAMGAFSSKLYETKFSQ